MSRENVELVQAAFRAFQDGDFDGVLRLCDEGIEITQPAELPDVTPRQKGHAGVLESFAIWPEQWDDYSIEILRIVEIGDRLLVATRQSGLGRGSGAPVEARFTFLFSFRAGKISRWRMFMQEQHAIQAAREPDDVAG